jgi:hypothetical protein
VGIGNVKSNPEWKLKPTILMKMTTLSGSSKEKALVTPIPLLAVHPRSKLTDILAFSHKRTAIVPNTTIAVILHILIEPGL